MSTKGRREEPVQKTRYEIIIRFGWRQDKYGFAIPDGKEFCWGERLLGFSSCKTRNAIGRHLVVLGSMTEIRDSIFRIIGVPPAGRAPNLKAEWRGVNGWRFDYPDGKTGAWIEVKFSGRTERQSRERPLMHVVEDRRLNPTLIAFAKTS